MRAAHVEALPFVGAIADARFQEAEGPCGAEKSGTGEAEPGTQRPCRGAAGRPSPCSAHGTASIAGGTAAPALRARRSRRAGAPTNQRGAGAELAAGQPITAALGSALPQGPGAPGGGETPRGRGHRGKGRGLGPAPGSRPARPRSQIPPKSRAGKGLVLPAAHTCSSKTATDECNLK